MGIIRLLSSLEYTKSEKFGFPFANCCSRNGFLKGCKEISPGNRLKQRFECHKFIREGSEHQDLCESKGSRTGERE